MSKKHYCYKIHTSLTEGNDSPRSIDKPLYGLPSFLKENLDTPLYDFSKISTPYTSYK